MHWREDVSQNGYAKQSPQCDSASWEMSLGVPSLPGSDAFLDPGVYAQPGCPYKLGTQTISWVRATVLGSGERWLWGGSEAEDGSPLSPPTVHPSGLD